MIPSSLNFTPQSLHARISHKAIPSFCNNTYCNAMLCLCIAYAFDNTLLVPLSLVPSTQKSLLSSHALPIFTSVSLYKIHFTLCIISYYILYIIVYILWCGCVGV